MEGGDQNNNNNNVGNNGDHQIINGGGSRWNPTKEQIEMLESLYKKGLRTPTAEQIQQITVRLRDFGHIEGKNVFYWFQNHKARQRQKQKLQKQEINLAYFNRFLHATSTPLFPPYHHHNVYNPCYNNMAPPRNIDSGFYHQHQYYPKVPLPTAAAAAVAGLVVNNSNNNNFKRCRPLIPDDQTIETRYKQSTQQPRRQLNNQQQLQETLDLFPIHPTGVLQSKNGTTHDHKNIIENKKSSSSSASSTPTSSENAGKDNHFFDFFL